MDSFKLKSEMLKSFGFLYLIPNNLYVNRKLKKVFSFEYVEKTEFSIICKNILEKNSSSEFKFYFLKLPSQGVMNMLKGIFKKSKRKGKYLIDKTAISSSAI